MADGDQTREKQPWGLAILAMVVVACVNGLTTTGLTVFDEAILTELAIDRTALKFRESINFWGAAILLPITGWLIDRGGARITAMVGLALLSAALFAYGSATSVVQLYWLHGVFAFAIGLSGSLAMIVLVTRLFTRQRGLAVGFALAGTSLGGIVMGRVNPLLLEALGWRQSFEWLALVPLVMLALVAFAVPKAGTSSATVRPADAAASLPLSAALGMPAFWLLALAGMLTFGAIVAVFQNVFLHLRDLGFAPRTAGLGLTLLSSCALVAKLAAGWLGDRFGTGNLLKLNIIVMGLGAAGLATLQPGLIWVSLAVIGLGWGAINTLINYLAIEVFGVGQAGRINGVISIFESLGAGGGPLVAAMVFDATGSYGAAFTGIVVALLAALAAIWTVRAKLRPAAA
jgi:nitrate/nitrite transporter NarK